MSHQGNLTIDPERLWDSLMATAAFGATPKGGINRLALSEEDRLVRDWLKAECEKLGCTVRVDRCGNMFATRPGRRPDLQPIAMGSHLDTQPTGGRFDGVLGVLAGLEVLRTLVMTEYMTHAPVMLVNWTNEEGSRFPPAMLSSAVYAGAVTTDEAHAVADRDGLTFGEALTRIGYLGTEAVGSVRFQAMFELHIEQGPVLEAEAKTIGIVTGVQGMRWYDVTLTGQDAHTGATPMALRRNALLGAARAIEAIEALGRRHPPGVATVGMIENRPNSRNVVPGQVFFSVDLRHPDEIALDRMESELRRSLAGIAAAAKLDLEERRIWNCPAVDFAPDLIDCVRRGAKEAGLPAREMASGAGHDAAYIAHVVPTTMIFVPCLGGITHNEAESATPEDCAAGAQVLLNAVLEYDRQFA